MTFTINFDEENGMLLTEQLIKFIPDRPGHDFRYSINCRKIQTDLGWQQTSNFQENLTKTVDWYYEFFQK